MALATAAPRRVAQAGKPASGGRMARGQPRAKAPFGGTLQAKLALGPVGDSYERQADAAAAHVVAGRPGTPALTALPGMGGMAQRACPACEEKEKAGRVQRKCACGAGHDEPCSCDRTEEEHPELRIDRKAKPGDTQGGDPIGAVADAVRGPGRPLPEPVRQDMEAGFGRPFGHVRVHDGPRAAASAEGIGAHAYTVGNHIAFNRGRFQPGTESGRFLLAHELAHTVQQSGAPIAAPTAAPRVSRPGDRHEAQADRAASAAMTGAPMPALTGGAAPISRYGASDAAGDAAEAATWIVGGPVAGMLFGDDANDLASSAAESVIDFGSDIYRTAVAIAEQLGVDVSIDGTTLVIAFDEFNPCRGLDLGGSLQLSDLGLDPTLRFPVGPPVPFFTVGIVTAAGMLTVELNLDPGLGFRLEDCSFGPGQIRIDALSGSASIAGSLSVTTATMVQMGADLGLDASLYAIIAWPDPPLVLMVPALGVALGGAMEFMLQNRGTLDARFMATASLGGVSGAVDLDADVGYMVDLSYGLYGAIRILGQDLCRLGWPLDSHHAEIAANLKLRAAASLDSSGLNFSFVPSVTPLGTNPLHDLSFAFDDSRMEDQCWLCEFLAENNALPSQNAYTWAGNVGNYPLLGGPEPDIFQRDPNIGSGALCRGTCGPDCADGSCEGNRRDLVVCENVGDSHVWHTYAGYETCGSHQGCRDHDACYDMMADTIWGFGGFMLGPGYRACDLDAVCQHGFQTSVGWAISGGPYDTRLRYADYAFTTPGCLGPCPPEREGEDGAEVQETCLKERELWKGVNVERKWGEELFNQSLITGFIPVPYVGQLGFGVNAMARADADAFAELGPIHLKPGCLIYDPATMTYTGTADMTLFANVGASASITGALEGFLSDPACFLNWITLRGTISAGILAQLPSQLKVGVDLYCENGELMILPRAAFKTCLDVTGDLRAGLDVFLLSFNVWGREWTLAEGTVLNECWNMEISFAPFSVGEMPKFDIASAFGALDDILDHMLPVATERNFDRKPARSPLPAAPRLLFPCLGGGGGDDDDDDDDGPSQLECPTKATGADGRRIVPDADDRGPHWPSTGTVSIPGGGSETVGHIMEAPYLESTITGGSKPGTQNSIYGNPGIPTEGCFTTSKKDTQRFVKGHLLNENIGGPGKGADGLKNLFPITGQMNANHKNDVEQGGLRVVPKVKADELIYYKVTVSGSRTPREIVNPTTGVGHGFYEVRSTFLCEVADYNLCTDDTLRRNPSQIVPVTQDFIFHPSGGDPFDQITDPSKC